MIQIKNLSIKKKLVAIQLLTTIILLFIYSVFLLINNIQIFRKSMVTQLSSTAKLIAANSVAALNFIDIDAAKETLSTLSEEDNIVNAWIYDADGNLFAQYSKSGFSDYSFPKTTQASPEFNDNLVVISRDIIQDQDVLGTLSLRAHMQQFQYILKKNILIVSLVLIIGIMIAFLLSIVMQRAISDPILHLVGTADKVSKTGDYSIRAIKESTDEIGKLCDTFNSMMQQIENRDMSLNEAHNVLENRVRERTQKLEQQSKNLAEANIQLQELDRLKSLFIASMSHELRTPLNAIIGFTGVMLQGMTGPVNEEQEKQLTLVNNSANHLLALINDVIDVSKIEAGKIDIFINEFNLEDFMQEITDSFSVAVKSKGLKMSLKTPQDVLVSSDKLRTKQVIMNLLSNAVKFTDKGQIEIEVSKHNGKIDVSVQDSGIGIEKEAMEKLFKPFSRIYSEGVLREGTGLGLYLTRKIADLLGGQVEAESTFGKGSKFTFTLPLKYQKEV